MEGGPDSNSNSGSGPPLLQCDLWHCQLASLNNLEQIMYIAWFARKVNTILHAAYSTYIVWYTIPMHWLASKAFLCKTSRKSVSTHRPWTQTCQMAFSLQSSLSQYIHNFSGWQFQVIFLQRPLPRYLSWFWDKCCLNIARIANAVPVTLYSRVTM